MPTRPRVHGPSVLGRMRSDPGPLVLIGLVVALTTALTSAVSPLILRTSDRALADAVRHAGTRGLVVATFPGADEEIGPRARDPIAAKRFRVEVAGAERELPKRVATLVRPATASITTPDLHLLGAGPGRYLSLAYLAGPGGSPHVRYTAGGPPGASVAADRTGTGDWPVQVAVSQTAATALGLKPGDRLEAADEQARSVDVRVSGIFVARDPDEAAWQTNVRLLSPTRGVSAGVARTSAAALVSAAALPDLRLAVPIDDLTERATFSPRPERLRWAQSTGVVRAIVALKASPGAARGEVSWDSDLDRVLEDARAQVAAARGQADVLLVGLLACALLVLWQAADLLVRRRSDSLVLTRERGGTLVGIATELVIETAAFAVGGAALGLLLTTLAVGDPGWGWWLPIPFFASVAAAVAGPALVARLADPRRTPANRTARRRLARALRLRRLLFMTVVVAGAALSFVALHERGVADAGNGDLAAASAPTWWAVAGALLVIAALPFPAALFLERTRGTSGGVVFLVAARVRETGTRALPLLVVMVTVAQLTFAISLASTEQRGQAAGALLSVGGDARVTVMPDHSATDLARKIAAAPGVRAAVAARVEDSVQATSHVDAETVRLVVVDASSYERLLAVSALPDAPALNRLDRDEGEHVPALLLGGASALREGLTVRGADDRAITLSVVGTAPRVQGSVDPVVVVDRGSYARAGGVADPNTVWAVGPGSAAAARAATGHTGTVASYADALAARRAAPLAQGLVRLAMSSAALLLIFAVLGVAMAASSESVPRGESLGRLRSLGLRDRELWRVLAGELTAPVLVGALAGLVLGISAALTMFGQLSLELITAQVRPPAVSISPWVFVGGLVLLVTALVLTHVEWTRLRAIVLGQLLRR